MHLQIKSVVVAGSGNTGARGAGEGTEGITIARPGRLLRLLDILAEDRRGGNYDRDGFSLVRAAGTAIETGGEFSFSVETSEENDYADHQAALDRILPEFPHSRIVEMRETELDHHKGSLRAYLQGFADDNLLIDEISIAVSDCPDPGTSGGTIKVPIQVSAIQALDYTPPRAR